MKRLKDNIFIMVIILLKIKSDFIEVLLTFFLTSISFSLAP